MSLLILLDLSAAFETVDHPILLSVLADRFSIDSMALSWSKSYLTDRTPICYRADAYNFPVDCSVPRGSVLGPCCFISYTEDLADLLDKHVVRRICTPMTLSSTPDADLTTLTHCVLAYLVVQTTSSHGACLVVRNGMPVRLRLSGSDRGPVWLSYPTGTIPVSYTHLTLPTIYSV